jgi:anti-sigma factor ChrR (cupin superfamily)
VDQGSKALARAGGDRVLEELEALLAPLAAAAPPVPPPPALWERLSAALDAEIEREAAASTQRVTEGSWEPYSPGVARRWLWDRRTFLLRIDAGAVLPAHAHDETEHCLVIQGMLAVGRLRIGPGDYHVGRAGTPHVEIGAPEGAIILVHNAP